ncbi:MAG: FKBP-type peptidyl-prolyl cis-trans isomerase [Paludibacteraceae bacterium]|nr:FKBP-type peptidyl-prolyl cis-trans isomerase [Paludibacteraceae bacterium]
MKKLVLFTAAAAALVLGSCGSRSVKIESDVDSLSYALGAAQSGLKMQLSNQIDTAYISEFLRGAQDVMLSDSKAKEAYAVGAQFGSWAKNNLDQAGQFFFDGDSTKSIDKAVYFAAIMSLLQNEDLLIESSEAQEYLNEKQLEARRQKIEKEYGDYKIECIAYLEENKKRENVIETESGLQYVVNKMGKGATPGPLDTVVVEYKGQLIDGTVFDDSSRRGKAVPMPLQRVVTGWQEGLSLMPVGSDFTLYIPYELGYGDMPQGSIKPFSTLIFDVKLVDIKPYVEKTVQE